MTPPSWRDELREKAKATLEPADNYGQHILKKNRYEEAANPQAILRLLDEHGKMREALEKVVTVCKWDGDYKECPICLNPRTVLRELEKEGE